MMRLMARMMPSCKDVSSDVSMAMDGRLPMWKRFMVRMHVSMCAICRRYENQLEMLRKGTKNYTEAKENDAEISASPELKERLKKTLSDRK